ncbi:MAG: SHOCT domain-containing protein [Paracoccaceae bacterium]
MSLSEELKRLEELRDTGTLTEAEFEAAKKKTLEGRQESPSGSQSTPWAIWALVIVVAVGAGGMLYFLDGISRSLELVVGSLGVVAAAAGTVMSVTEDFSIMGVIAFIVLGLAIGAVAFAAMAPVILLAALVIVPVVFAWGWITELFTG